MQFEPTVQVLHDADVEFVILGGVSAILHGSARFTKDLDICFSRSAANLRKLALALAPFHPRLRDLPETLPFVWDETTLRNGTVFTLKTDLGDIDLLAEVAGLGEFDAVKARSVLVNVFDRNVSTLDLPALIAAKKAAGRPKDLESLHELESLLEAQQSE